MFFGENKVDRRSLFSSRVYKQKKLSPAEDLQLKSLLMTKTLGHGKLMHWMSFPFKHTDNLANFWHAQTASLVPCRTILDFRFYQKNFSLLNTLNYLPHFVQAQIASSVPCRTILYSCSKLDFPIFRILHPYSSIVKLKMGQTIVTKIKNKFILK